MAAGQDLDPDLWRRLPDEVLEQVLPHLPVESIFRFRAVCKQWSEFPFSPKFRASCRHGIMQSPILLAMRSVEDLSLSPVLSSHGKKWRSLGLGFLHQALLLSDCDRITSIGNDGGLLCVSALNTVSRSVIFVCNPLTHSYKILPPINNPWSVIFRQLVVRVEPHSRHYRIFIFGQDLDTRRQQTTYLYSSRDDSVTALPRVINTLGRTCGAFMGGMFYTLSPDHELIGFDTECPNWTQKNMGIVIAEQADGYKIVVHDNRVFCAMAKEGNPNCRDDVVEFRIFELILRTRQCVRLNINLQCLFVNDSLSDSKYDWDFTVHNQSLLLVARSRVEDPRDTRWLEVVVGSQHLPSLEKAFCSISEKWRFTDRLCRSLMLTSLLLDLQQEVEFA